MAEASAIGEGLAARPIIAVLPASDAASARRAALALLEAGAAAMVVPWTNAEAAALVAGLREVVGEAALLGASLVPGPAEARAALEAGAGLVISAAVRPAIVPLCHMAGALCALGALTPTEALTATEAAADYVRLGPLDALGGPAYLAALRAHFPWVAWLAAGDFPAEMLLAYRMAGAALFEVGTALLPPALVEAGREAALADHVARFLGAAEKLPPLGAAPR